MATRPLPTSASEPVQQDDERDLVLGVSSGTRVRWACTAARSCSYSLLGEVRAASSHNLATMPRLSIVPLPLGVELKTLPGLEPKWQP